MAFNHNKKEYSYNLSKKSYEIIENTAYEYHKNFIGRHNSRPNINESKEMYIAKMGNKSFVLQNYFSHNEIIRSIDFEVTIIEKDNLYLVKNTFEMESFHDEEDLKEFKHFISKCENLLMEKNLLFIEMSYENKEKVCSFFFRNIENTDSGKITNMLNKIKDKYGTEAKETLRNYLNDEEYTYSNIEDNLSDTYDECDLMEAFKDDKNLYTNSIREEMFNIMKNAINPQPMPDSIIDLESKEFLSLPALN